MTIRPNNGAGVSRYLRLYSVLSQALAEGRISAGDPLPSEPRLVQLYAVSRSTVRRALARLEAEGRIVRKRGSGTYAQKQGPAALPVHHPPVNGSAALPAITGHRTITCEHIATPGFLAREQLGFGATALLIRRVGYAGREPIVLEAAYVPEAIGRQLTQRRLTGKAGAILSILASLGHRSASLEREFAALAADPVTANTLGLAVGAPILNVRTVVRDSRHHMLAYINLFHRPDRYEARAAIKLHGQTRSRTGRRS